ncbi:MAG: ArsR family transcriptional regulator [Epsilonproteobacteria bacterium (ex Lamellibrachia satsuma)]|nr:MAG: ArsR family transcriptional regulator [Epsilonproteobacteria bacterium (ex Lamellibrachia satsuma)]
MKRIVQLSKIFSDSNRVKILALILRDKEICVCEICDTLQLSQPLVSRHLKQMREADILDSRQAGKWVTYFLKERNDPFLQCCIAEIRKELPSLPKLAVCKTKYC